MRRICYNMIFNVSGTAIDVIASFIIAPHLINTLGEISYGFWIVIGTLTSYFGLLDFGIRSAVGRNIAYAHSQGNTNKVREIICSSFFLLNALAVVGVIGIYLTHPLVFGLVDQFEIGSASVGLLVFLICANLYATIVFNVFDAILWGTQSFGIMNCIDSSSSCLRLTLILLYIQSNTQLEVLLQITFCITLLTGVTKMVASWFTSYGLVLMPGKFGISTIRELLNYSSWSFVYNVGTLFRNQFTLLSVGYFLGVQTVAYFSIGLRLLNYGNELMVALLGVITPYATALHAKKQTDKQKCLFVNGGMLAFGLSALISLLILLLGKQFVELWLGREIPGIGSLFLIMSLGNMLPNSQLLSINILFASARHRVLAINCLFETLAVSSIIVILVPYYELTGVLAAIVSGGILFRGIANIWIGCRVVNCPIGDYMLTALFPAAICTLSTAIMAMLTIDFHNIDTWMQLLINACIIASVYITAFSSMLFLKLFCMHAMHGLSPSLLLKTLVQKQ